MKRFLSLLLAMMILFTLPGCSGNKGSAEDAGMNWQEQYDLGIRYLSEGNYEEAIIAFTAAIQIDPKRVDAYVSLADVYVELGDMENAIATLESGYAQTQSAELQAYLDSLKAEAENPVGPHSATPFEYRDGYVEYDTLSVEQMAFVDELITALQAKDRETLTALALRFESLFERQGEAPTLSTLLTRNDTYKIEATLREYPSDNRWLIVQIRPETGMGYYADIYPESWANANMEERIVWSYSSCPCVDWQPEGDYSSERETYRYSFNETTHAPHVTQVMSTDSGTAADGVLLTKVHTFYDKDLATGDQIGKVFTREITYENGHRVTENGLTEPIWTPFCGGYHDLDRIFW